MKTMLLRAIRLYQRHLSQRKGYACAWRVRTGGASCSALGYRAIRRHGAWRGLLILRVRLQRCAQAQRALTLRHRPRLHSQAGYCDAPGICGETGRGLTSGYRSAACVLNFVASPLGWLWPSREGDAYNAEEDSYSWLVQILSAVRTLYGAAALLMLWLMLMGRHGGGQVMGEGGLMFLSLPWYSFMANLPGRLGADAGHELWYLAAGGVLLNFVLLSALVSLAKRAEEVDEEE